MLKHVFTGKGVPEVHEPHAKHLSFQAFEREWHHTAQDMLRLCERFFTCTEDSSLHQYLLHELPLRAMHNEYKQRHFALSSVHKRSLREACTQLARFLLVCVPASTCDECAESILGAIMKLPSSIKHQLMDHMNTFHHDFALSRNLEELPASEANDILFPESRIEKRAPFLTFQKTTSSRDSVSLISENQNLGQRVTKLQGTIVRLRRLNHELHIRNAELANMLEDRFDVPPQPISPATDEHSLPETFEESIIFHLEKSSQNTHLHDTIYEQERIIEHLKHDLDTMFTVQRENETLKLNVDILSSQLKEKVNVEERCTSLESLTTDLRSKLRHKTKSFDSLCSSHVSLNERFHSLMSQHFNMSRKLRECKESLRQMSCNLADRTTQFNLLMKQHNQVISSWELSQDQLKVQTQKLSDIHEELIQLKQQFQRLNNGSCMGETKLSSLGNKPQEPNLHSPGVMLASPMDNGARKQEDVESVGSFTYNSEEEGLWMDTLSLDEDEEQIEMFPRVEPKGKQEDPHMQKKVALWAEIDLILSTL